LPRFTVLEPEAMYPDTLLEQEILGPDVAVLHGGAPPTESLDSLPTNSAPASTAC
jgi:C-terminal binding protein